MYPEYSKVQQYLDTAKDLMKTGRRLSDIYEFATCKKYRREKAVTILNEKGKPVSYNYNKYKLFTNEMAAKIATILADVPTGSVVALKVKNSPDWIHLFWGLLMNGFNTLLIDAKLPKENTENLLKQSKAQAIITGEIISYTVKTASVDDIKASKMKLQFTHNWADEVIFCSSGTTGSIKLMVFNGENLCNQVAASLKIPETSKDLMNKDEINILAFVPFHHVFGFVAVFLWFTFYGKNIVFVKDISTNEILKTCDVADVTHVFAVPLLWDSLAQGLLRKAELEGPEKLDLLHKMIAYNTGKITSKEAGLAATKVALRTVQNQLLGHHIKFCISGGGGVRPESLEIINGIGYPLYNGFGMTEVGVTSVELSPNVKDRLLSSVGIPFNGIEYKIDESKGNSGEGELLIKSKQIHVREIIGGEERMTELEDGWMRTGDVASITEDGRCYIKGRMKDIIINANGENIYPDEIESYFEDLPFVNKIVVLGVKEGKSITETITCVIELNGDADEDGIAALEAKCQEINKGLASEKKVQKFLLAMEKLPLTTTMKVKRFQVKEDIKNNPNNYAMFGQKKEIKHFEGYDTKDVEPIVKQLRKIFAQVLILPIIKIEDDAHWTNNLGGDSMSYVEVITKINEEFEISIPEEQYGKLTNVNEFAEEILALKGIAKK